MSDLKTIVNDMRLAGIDEAEISHFVNNASDAQFLDLGSVYLVYRAWGVDSIFVYFIKSKVARDVWPDLEALYREEGLSYVYGVYVSEGMRAKAKAREEFEVIRETARSLYGRFVL